jgi:nitrogen fixation protein NifU and related proteins
VNSDLRELYQSVILDHHKKPRNFRQLPDADRHAEGYNPLCGDRVSVYLKLEGDVVKEVSFVGAGCAISTASASMMTESLRGKTRAEAEALFQRFHKLLTGNEPSGEAAAPALGKLEVFGGVREFPIRVKCATLAWHTLVAALDRATAPVKTE